MSRRMIIAGNWKMNKNSAEARDFIAELKGKADFSKNVEVAVCPPFTSLQAAASAAAGSAVKVGAQNMHWEESGAYTGEISASMLAEIPVSSVIIGHSERRQYFGETDDTVNQRVKAVLKAGFEPIMCVGETKEQREADKTEEIVERQLKGGLQGLTEEDMKSLVIAYEPVWAIGTGLTATPEQAQAMHDFIRKLLSKLFSEAVAEAVPILYGGSVKPGNAAELMAKPDIDGALVGGASLKADDFAGIINAC